MKEIKFKIITLLFSIIILCIFYTDVLINPNAYLFSASGDGIKNYYTSHYFVKHGELGFHTQGLNYPYGEVISFTDNQPIISWVILLLKNIGIDLSDYVIGIYNFLMLLSICIASFFYFLIARKFYFPPLYAMCVALIIAFLSPQIERITGHYSLAYACFVPILWYLLIRTYENNYKLRFAIFILIYNLVFGLIHPYYILIGTLFSLTYTLCNYLYNKPKLSLLTIQVVVSMLPPILLQLIFKSVDTITDRPTNPWGLLDYATRFEGVFLPVNSPALDFLNSFLKIRSTDIETHSYVGVLGLVVFILSIIKIVKYLKNKKINYVLKPILPKELRTSILVAVLILLFAMAIPFRVGLSFLLELVPAIKQFRSLGRFAWVFYSVFTMYSAFYLFLIYRKWKIQHKKTAATVLVLVLMSVWAIEAFINNKHALKFIQNKTADNYYTKNTLQKMDSLRIDVKSFQSILPLPIYLIGSEVIGIHNDETNIVFHTMKTSVETGLPINSTMLSRTSLSQTIKLASFVSDTLLSREQYLKDLNSKDILVITKDIHLSTGEQYVLSKSDFLFTDHLGFKYYKLNPAKLKANNYYVDVTEYLVEKEGRNTLGKHDWYYWESLNDGKYISNEFPELFNGEVVGSGNYECSFWLKLSNKHIVPKLVLETFDKQNQLIEKKNFDCGVFANVQGNWMRVSNVFTYAEKESRIRFSLITKGDTIKNLLIKPQNIKVITSKNAEKRVDNFIF